MICTCFILQQHEQDTLYSVIFQSVYGNILSICLSNPHCSYPLWCKPDEPHFIVIVTIFWFFQFFSLKYGQHRNSIMDISYTGIVIPPCTINTFISDEKYQYWFRSIKILSPWLLSICLYCIRQSSYFWIHISSLRINKHGNAVMVNFIYMLILSTWWLITLPKNPKALIVICQVG